MGPVKTGIPGPAALSHILSPGNQLLHIQDSMALISSSSCRISDKTDGVARYL
jgi:hypothetical protein